MRAPTDTGGPPASVASARDPVAGRGSAARLTAWLLEPRDPHSLAFFRIAFGSILVWEAARYLLFNRVYGYWLAPTFLFPYPGFEWVRPWPGGWLYVHFIVLGALALYVATGLFYRVSMALFAIGFAYVFLLEQTVYLNHWYLVILVSFLMVAVPAHRCWSLDARFKPGVRSDVVPAWSLYLLRAQIGLVYFFAGVAKLNGDWLRGEPMRDWLSESTDFPLVGGLFTAEPVVYLASYFALALDLLAFPLLLWRRTRPYVFCALIAFHLMNFGLFDIGMFPWFMLAATTLFFSPDWPVRLLARVRHRLGRPAAAPPASARDAPADSAPAPRLSRAQAAGFAALAAYLAVQVLVPLRHFAYPGNVHWTEEGHRFSWHMKLRDKRARGVAFTVLDPDTGRRWNADPRRFLTPLQVREMTTEPDMVRLYSRHVAGELRRRGVARRPQVRAWVPVSLNSRPYQLMIDPEADLASKGRWLPPADWILPLEPPRYP